MLNRYLSTKTMFDVRLGCDEEAKQILQASCDDSLVKCAVLSLKALREDLEKFGDDPDSTVRHTSGHKHGLQQYHRSLGGLAASLCCPTTSTLTSALLCCQVFIGIEQIRKDHTARTQHIIQGLAITREYRARPGIDGLRRFLPARNPQLPLLDVFIIRVFAAPCKFKDRPATCFRIADSSLTCSSARGQISTEVRRTRKIAPDTRTELIKIAVSTLNFLDSIAQIKSADAALKMLHERASLLGGLRSWFAGFASTRGEEGDEPVSLLFERMFHHILNIIILGALDYSSDPDASLQVERCRLQELADNVTERVRTYTMCRGTGQSRSAIRVD